jgi:N-acetylmuramoyl-L-alanine amidase
MNPLVIILGGFGVVGLAKLLSGGASRFAGVIDVVNSLPRHAWKVYPSRKLSQIEYLVIHHSAAENQSPETIANFHVNSSHLSADGAPGIAYHFYIREDGTAYQTNQLETISWHVANNNTKCVGICLSGNLENRPPTEAQKNSAVQLVRQLKRQLGNVQVKPHGFFKATACPGRYLDMNIFN